MTATGTMQQSTLSYSSFDDQVKTSFINEKTGASTPATQLMTSTSCINPPSSWTSRGGGYDCNNNRLRALRGTPEGRALQVFCDLSKKSPPSKKNAPTAKNAAINIIIIVVIKWHLPPSNCQARLCHQRRARLQSQRPRQRHQ